MEAVRGFTRAGPKATSGLLMKVETMALTVCMKMTYTKDDNDN
jgi:hypothetical protein